MKRFFYITTILAAFALQSCNDWLDVTPKGEAEAEALFQDERGFYSALAGSYQTLTSGGAYGNQLTAGFVDQIAQYWKENNQFGEFDYTSSTPKSTLLSTWTTMYEIIANVNLILDNFKHWNGEDMEYHDLIKGEALGLRAYLHFDLLRLFGPVPKNGLDQKAIPYREEFSNNIGPQLTIKQVTDKIIKDLEEAYALLKEDPIKTYGRNNVSAPNNSDLAFRYRGLRMNYFAVCATLARTYLWIGDKTNALKYSMEIIEDDTFRLLSRDDRNSANKDALYQMEIIWAMYYNNIENLLGVRFSLGGYEYDEAFQEYVYQDAQSYGSLEDYRIAANTWWFTSSTTPMYHSMRKYRRSYDNQDRDITPWDRVVAMIRLSEIYYIAAEANLGSDNAKAYELLNMVRDSRNLTPLPEAIKTDANKLLEQIVFEYQKDFWGEGKLFYTYKRLFHNIIIRNNTIQAKEAIFELPIPKSELEYGGY